MLKDQKVDGFFLTGEKDYSSGQILRKGVIDVHGDLNYFFTDVFQKTREKKDLSVVHIKVCKKQTYNPKKGKNIFSLKTKSGAEVLSVVPASEWQKGTALQPQIAMV